MRVLVTGNSGFIGGALAPLLEARGHEVRGLGRATRDADAAFAGCEAAVHLANIAHIGADRALLWEVNVEGTRRMAALAAKHGVRRLVYLSSIKASGDATTLRPFDGSEAAPRDDYGRAKLAAEAALREVASGGALEVVVLRPPLVYGPGVKANFFALLRAIARGIPLPLAGIENRRSLVFVGNLCRAILACLESDTASGKTYVVSDGATISTPQLCRGIGAALGRPARLFRVPAVLLPVKALTCSLEVDDSAIRSELGWNAPFSVEQGLSATAAWYRNR